MDRLISEDCPLSSKLASLSMLADSWWNRFHLAADDWGVFPANPKIIKGKLWPLRDDMTVDKISKIIEEYETSGLVLKFQHKDQNFGFFVGWFEHQNSIKYLSARKYPSPPESLITFEIKRNVKLNGQEEERFGAKNVKVIFHFQDVVPKIQNSVLKIQPISCSCTGSCTCTDSYKNPPLPPQGGMVVENFFETFWNQYPRKVSKQSAVKSFERLKLSKEDFEKMLAALAVHKATEQWTKDGGKFIPHPASWLNGRRWEDEISTQTIPAADIPRQDPEVCAKNVRQTSRNKRWCELELKNECSCAWTGYCRKGDSFPSVQKKEEDE